MRLPPCPATLELQAPRAPALTSYARTAVFSAGPALTRGKTYPVQAPITTPAALASEYGALTGEKTRFEPLALEEAVGLMVRGDADGEGRREFTEMFQCVGRFPPSCARGSRRGTDAKGPRRFIADGVDGKSSFAAGIEHDSSLADLGVRASNLQMFLERSGFRVGQKT